MKRMFLLATVFVGCAPAVSSPPSTTLSRNATPEHSTKLNESPRPMKPRALDSVTIYKTKVPAADYVEVSELADSGDDGTEALDKLKLSAAGVGCDGLIIGEQRIEADRPRVFGGGHVVSSIGISGTCIMFVQDPGTWRPSEIDARCAADRDRLSATKDPDERLAITRAMPRACHPE